MHGVPSEGQVSNLLDEGGGTEEQIMWLPKSRGGVAFSRVSIFTTTGIKHTSISPEVTTFYFYLFQNIYTGSPRLATTMEIRFPVVKRGSG